MATVLERREWISARQVAARLGISVHSVGRVADANGIRRKVVPGAFTTFYGGDVAALAARCVEGEGIAGASQEGDRAGTLGTLKRATAGATNAGRREARSGTRSDRARDHSNPTGEGPKSCAP